MSKKASVLMITSKYRSAGGHETVMDYLCTGLQKLGHKMAIGAFSFERDPPADIVRVNLNKFGKLTGNLREHDIDIIHSHQTLMNYYLLSTRIPFLFHYHGASTMIQKINLKASFLLLRNKITRIITISNSGLCDFKGLVRTNTISPDVIYNGVDTNLFCTGLPRPYKKGNPQLLFVGRLYPSKNIMRIVLKMPDIVSVYPDAHLQIVGSGNEYKRLKDTIREKKLEGIVELTGSVPNDDLRMRYSSCDIYISASKWEMFALPVLEAMSCGKPVILSDIPVHKELLEASNAGKCFSLADENDVLGAVGQVYENRQLFGYYAHEFALKCDWSKTCKKISDIYDQIMEHNTVS